jgi:hypothetical protein
VASVYVKVVPTNQRPTAVEDWANTPVNTPVIVDVLGNDSDTDGSIDPTSVVLLTANKSYQDSTATVNPTTGQVTVNPRSNFTGDIHFHYMVRDNDGRMSNVAALHVSVNPVLPPPIAHDDRARTFRVNNLYIAVQDNDESPSGTLSKYNYVKTLPTTQGGWVWSNSFNPVVQYESSYNFIGTDSFEYRVVDSNGSFSNYATVEVDVVDSNIVGNIKVDSRVDGGDLGILMSRWGSNNLQSDLNLDFVVDAQDLAVILQNLPCAGIACVAKLQ